MRGRSPLMLGVALAASLTAAEARAGSCSFGTVVGVAFGIYDVFSTFAVQSTGSLVYNCAGVGAISITLSRGNASTFFPRQMLHGATVLAYNLFTDAAHTSVWGDGTSGTATYTNASPPNGGNVSVTFYGRIPALQNVSVGTYGDTITATIDF